MRIDTGQLVVIMIVRVLVCRWIIGVIHTRTQVSIVEILVLVVQPQRVTYLLTRNQVSPRGRVVSRCVEVGIVQFHRALRNVFAADPNLSYPQPTVIAIRVVTYLYSAARWTTVPPCASSRHYGGVKNS